MSKNKTIQSDDILEDIINNIEKPMYEYEENLNFNELWKDVKMHLLRKDRVIFFLKILFLVSIICFLFLRFVINNIFIIFLISFISSLILTIYLLKKDLLKATTRKLKVLFYDSFLIIKSKDRIIKFSYNELLGIDNKPKFYVIYFNDNYRYIMIDKNQIDNKITDFLENIQTDYKSVTNDKEESENIWNSIEKYLKKNSEVSCDNAITPETINQFCNLKQERKRVIVYEFFSVTLVAFIAFHIYNGSILISDFTLGENITSILLVLIFSYCMCIGLLNLHMNDIEKSIVKDFDKNSLFNFKFYFLENFIILKTTKKMMLIKYNDIKYSLKNEKYIFIKFKFFKSITEYCTPSILDKNKLTDQQIKHLYKFIKIRN